MKTKMKYYIAELEASQGEYTHTTKYLFKTEGDPFKYAETITKKWYGDDEVEKDEYSNGYWHNGGEVLTSVGDVKKISMRHYNVLKKDLSVLQEGEY